MRSPPDDPRQRQSRWTAKDRPYSVYEQLDFDVCVGEGLKGTLGDCWIVIGEDAGDEAVLRILPQCVAQLPDARSAPSSARDEGPAGECTQNTKIRAAFRLLHRSQGARSRIACTSAAELH